MIEFIAAVYNEENNIASLIDHVYPFVDRFIFVDDGSTDTTGFQIGSRSPLVSDILYKRIIHTGLPETVKAHALELAHEDSWIIMLDADERFAPGVLYKIQDFINSEESKKYTHIWFNLEEAIDGKITRNFIKCRVFRKSAAVFSDSIHIADSFSGNGFNGDWTVLHYKTSAKQIMREKEYIDTYDRLVAENKITSQKRNELKAMHYFIK